MNWIRVRTAAAKRARLAVGVTLAGLFLYLAVGTIDAGAALRSALAARLDFLVLGVGLVAIGFLLRIVRWWLLLRPMQLALQLRDCVGPLLIGFAVNNLVPFRAGDALRVVGFRRRLGVDPPQVLGTLALERGLDLLALLLYFFIGLSQAHPGLIPSSFVGAGIALTGALLAAGAVVVVWPRQVRRLIGRAAAVEFVRAHRWPHLIADVAVATADALLVLESRRSAAVLMVLSLLIWFVEGLVFASVAVALGVVPGIFGAHFAMAVGTLATMIPSTPGYVGTFDFFTRLGLQAYGVTAVIATVFAVTVHLVLWWPVTATGVALFLSPRTAPSIGIAAAGAGGTASD
jgi:uncharacterized membrane protein YbhN (UPF0104 family)